MPVRGSAVYVSLSPEQVQRFIYVINEVDEQVEILAFQPTYPFGFRPRGSRIGELTRIHNSAVDSKGNLFISEVSTGEGTQARGCGRLRLEQWHRGLMEQPATALSHR